MAWSCGSWYEDTALPLQGTQSRNRQICHRIVSSQSGQSWDGGSPGGRGKSGGLLGEGARVSKVRYAGCAEVSLARPAGGPGGRGKSLGKGLKAKVSI